MLICNEGHSPFQDTGSHAPSLRHAFPSATFSGILPGEHSLEPRELGGHKGFFCWMMLERMKHPRLLEIAPQELEMLVSPHIASSYSAPTIPPAKMIDLTSCTSPSSPCFMSLISSDKGMLIITVHYRRRKAGREGCRRLAQVVRVEDSSRPRAPS